MDLRQLHYFKAAAEELHFGRASRRLNLSQPALSHQIKALEEEVGVTLLDRDRRSVSLTPAGAVLLKHASAILAACETALEATREAAGIENNILRVGFVDYLNLSVIARSIAAYRAENPEVVVEQMELPTAEVWAGLVEDRIDVGFGVAPVTHDTLITKKIAAGQWLLVFPETDNWASEDSVDIAYLHKKPLIIFDRALNPALYDGWTARFEAAGCKPNIVYETKQVQTALQMARDGVGYYLVVSYIVPNIPEGLAARPLCGFKNSIEIAAAWRESDKSLVLHRYLDKLRAQ